jgi:hypothetical protein
MTTDMQKMCKQTRLAVLAFSLVLGVAAVVAVQAATGNGEVGSFLRVRTNVSESPTLASVVPDLAVSPDQDTVAVVWVEGYEPDVPVGHVYLRAAPALDVGWGSRLHVFTGTAETHVYKASVAITGSTAHVAYVVQGSTFEVRHRTCQLPDGPCNDDETAVSTTTNDIFWVDLALDESGYPQVVWPEKPADGVDVRYAAYTGSAWVITDVVTSESDYNHKPSVSWADGYAHVVWLRETSGPEYEALYKRCHPVTGCGSEFSLSGAPESENAYPPGSPVVAAGEGRVFAVWDRCAYYEAGPGEHCQDYNLLYRRSNDAGTSWLSDTFEVGSSYTYTEFAGYLQYYSSTTLMADERRGRLNPSVALSSDGWPAMAWHADRSPGGAGTDYVIYYAYSTSGTVNTVDWITRTVLSSSQEGIRVGGSIGVGREDGDECPDIAYIVAQSPWEVMYDSDREYLQIYVPLTLRN